MKFCIARQAVLALAFALGCSRATGAETYALVQVGKAHFANPARVWHNFDPVTRHGYGWEANERSSAWAIGLGRKLFWGALEVAYHDFGETNSYAAYPYDEGSPSLPPGCVYPCTNPQWVYHHGTAQGLAFSVLPEIKPLRADFALFARAGLTLYRATFDYCIADMERFPEARQPNCRKWHPTYAVTPHYGLGVRVGWLTLEVTRYHDLRARDPEHQFGNFQRIDTFAVGARVFF